MGCIKLKLYLAPQLIFFFMFSILNHAVKAAETQIDGAIKTTGIVYTQHVGESDSSDNIALLLEPSLTATYQAKKADVAAFLSQTVVRKKNDDEDINKSFTDLKLNSNFKMIENLLMLNVTASQNYQTLSQSDNFLADKVLASGELSKVQRYSALLNLDTPKANYVAVGLQTSYSKTESEQSLNNTGQLSSNNQMLTAHLYNGKRLRKVMFDLMANYNDTKRENANDFTSNQVSGNIRLAMFKHTNIVIQGTKQSYNFNQQTQDNQRRKVDSKSYGGGLEFFQNENRSIEITYNKFSESENETSYIGLNIDWAFTSRTAFKANYAKRFYGDAYSASFKFNTKSLRSNLTYSEDVTSFARLSQTSESLGVFVCTIGATELSECFQPDDLNYVLQAGEEFKSFNQISTDISDEVNLSKSARYVLGYDKRKLKISFNVAYRENEYLESTRFQKTKSAGIDIDYQLGKRTNIGFNANVSKGDGNTSRASQDTMTVNLSADRKLSKNTKVDIGLRYLTRDSIEQSRDISDKRLTLGLNYTF